MLNKGFYFALGWLRVAQKGTLCELTMLPDGTLFGGVVEEVKPN